MEEKNILAYITGDSMIDEVYICDDKGERTITNAEFKKMKKDYTLFFLSRKRGNKGTLKEFYDYVSKCAKELKVFSKGKINLYKTGLFSKTSKMIWNLMRKKEVKELQTEDLTDLEVKILDETKGSLIFSEKGYKGEGYFYDFNSFYPSIMQDKTFKIPYKQPKEQTIKKLSQAYWQNAEGISYLKYGFIRCNIEKSGIEEIDRLFRFQDDKWYCSQDIQSAKLLKLKINVIDDGKTNFLYYDNTKCIKGDKLFGAFVNYMYDLKQKKVSGSKDVLNSLWGAICQKKLSKTKKEVENPLKIRPTLDGLFSYVEREHPYNPYARLKRFLLAEGRLIIVKTILKYGQDIVQCHTDGFISKKKLNDITSSTDLGSIKYEGCKQVHIICANEVKIIDIKIKGLKEISL
jgi:hypothetical protein